MPTDCTLALAAPLFTDPDPDHGIKFPFTHVDGSIELVPSWKLYPLTEPGHDHGVKRLSTNRDELCCSLVLYPDDTLGREALWAERHRLLKL